MAPANQAWYGFGIGDVFATPSAGDLASPSYPQFLGVLQDVNVGFKQKLQKLMGQEKMPVDVAPSDMEITGKAAFARLEVDAFDALMFADTVTTGGVIPASREKHTVTVPSLPAWADGHDYALAAIITDTTNMQIVIEAGHSETPGPPSWNTDLGGLTADGTVVWKNVGPVGAGTVSVTNVSTWTADRGVMYSRGLVPMIPILVGSPAAGQYIVTAGVYTFNAADAGAAIVISYKYTVADGRTLSVTNHLQGYGPIIEIDCIMPYRTNTKPNNLYLRACRVSAMGAPQKRDNYIISDFEFEAYPDADGVAFDWYQSPNNG
jgi:hypothetical protein